MKKIFSRKIIWLAAALLLAIVWLAWGNVALMVNRITVTSCRLPNAFDGFRIAQISDLHNAEFGQENTDLLEMLSETQPDIIALTGDLVDSRRTDIDLALAFVREAVKIAPVYYVNGNHESRIPQYVQLKSGLEAAGVTILEDASVLLEKNGGTIRLVGLIDPAFFPGEKPSSMVGRKLAELMAGEDIYTVLLSHRPELFDAYVAGGGDLTLSGHAHGGQFRLPFLGGVYAPNQGWLPSYDAGLYSENGANMVVSRGIGNSLFPFRVNNRPEIVLIELHTKKA